MPIHISVSLACCAMDVTNMAVMTSAAPVGVRCNVELPCGVGRNCGLSGTARDRFPVVTEAADACRPAAAAWRQRPLELLGVVVISSMASSSRARTSDCSLSCIQLSASLLISLPPPLQETCQQMYAYEVGKQTHMRKHSHMICIFKLVSTILVCCYDAHLSITT